MALIPTLGASFGDSTTTEGKVYILAQYHSSADLSWVAELREALGVSELKYKAIREHRPRLRRDRVLWSRVEAGVGQASLFLVDRYDEACWAFLELSEERGYDFGNEEITEAMLESVVAHCPLAWLPRRLYEMERGNPYANPPVDLDYTPTAILRRVGPRWRTVITLAARAHAMFDVEALRQDRTVRSTRDIFLSPAAWPALLGVLETKRNFDVEAPATLPLLNSASDAIADALDRQFPMLVIDPCPLVYEAASEANDYLQAADVAAGWAREVLDAAGRRALVCSFERVWVHGCRQ